MELAVLGPFTLRTDRGAVVLGAAMQRRLLALLACRVGQFVPVDTLIDALWPAAPPPTARKTMQVYVRRLRQALGDPRRIQHHASSYRLDLGPNELDAQRFERLVAAARALRRADLRGAGTLFDQALALWRGEPYADVGDAAPLADEAARLQELRLKAGEDRIDVRLDLGRHAEVIPELRRLVRGHPYRERLRAQYMLALYRSGRQAEALAVFRAAREALAGELGIDPGPGLRELHGRILAADPSLAAVAPASVTAALTPVPRQLPGDVAGFTGRESQLSTLDAMVPPADATGPVTVVAIGGPPGVGKTALAVHWAHRAAPRFPDGQLYADLRGSDPRATVPAATVISGFLGALGVPPERVPAGEDARAALYRSLLADKRVLIVLDDARGVHGLLPGGPGCAVLVTGRGDHTDLVASCGAHPMELPPLSPTEARELLAQRIGRSRVEAEPATVARIVADTGGLPAAVTEVAAYAATHPRLPLGVTRPGSGEPGSAGIFQ